LVEELLEAKQQVVVLDPPGAWWVSALRPTARSRATPSSCSVGSTATCRRRETPAVGDRGRDFSMYSGPAAGL